jgi:hypothetical protein
VYPRTDLNGCGVISLAQMEKKNLPSSGFLRGMKWSETDVSGLPIGPSFKGQDEILLGHLDP